MSAKLYDQKSGQWVEVPDDQVDATVSGGDHVFPAGVDVPVTRFDGTLGTIKAEEAHKAIASGDFRWQTQEDRNRDFDMKNKQILEKNFGDQPGTAAAMGALETATLGGSNIVARGLVSAGNALGLTDATGEDLANAGSEVRERNPGAHLAGSLAGLAIPTGVTALGSTLGKGLGVEKALGEAAAGAGETAGFGAEEATMLSRELPSRAALVLAKASDRILGGALEGAYYGLGNGVSEAALGKPEDVVDHLISNIGMGALIGQGFGALGTVVSEAAPALKQLAGKVIDPAADAVRAAARAVTKGVVIPSLGMRGEAELAKLAPEIADNPEIKNLIATGQFEKAKALAKEAMDARAAFEDQQGAMESDLRDKLKSTTKEEKYQISKGLEEAGGDIKKMTSNFQNNVDNNRANLDLFFNSQQGMAQGNQAVFLRSHAEDFVKAVEASSERGSQRLADDVASYVKSNLSGAAKTVAEEGRAMHGLYDFARQAAAKGIEGADTFMAKLETAMERSPAAEIQDSVNSIIKPQNALDAVQSAVSSSVKSKDYRNLAGVLSSPEKMAALRPMLENLSEFVPDIKQALDKATSMQAKDQILRQARDRVSEMAQKSVNGKVSLDDMEEIFKMVAPARGDIRDRISQIKSASDILRSSADMDPWASAISFMKATGKDPSILEKALPYRKYSDAWDKLNDMNIAKPFIGKRAAGLAGYVLGHYPGAVAGEAVSAYSSPARAMKNLFAIEKMATKGANKLKSATDAVIDSLTKPVVTKVATVGKIAGSSDTDEDLPSRRKKFAKISDNLQTLSSPDGMIEHLSKASGGLENIPKIKLALQTSLQGAVGFLSSKLPQDPMAGYSIGPTKWEPSDKDLAQFYRYMDAVDNPTKVLTKIAAGTVTPEETETLRTVYPSIYSNLQTTVTEAIMNHGDAISYPAKMQLAEVFQVPTDFSLTPDFINKMQSQFADQDNGKQEPAQVKRARPTAKLNINPMTTVATEATKVSEGKYGEG